MTVQQHPGEVSEQELEPLDSKPVEEVLRALSSTLRSYRLYEGNNPMLDRFVQGLQQKVRVLWDELPELRLQIEEHRIRWEGQQVYPVGEASTELPFLFYKDGIRDLTILPGFEEEELLAFVRVVAHVPAIRSEEDDLITLLWQEDLQHLRYTVVESSAEGVELNPGVPSSMSPLDMDEFRAREHMPETAKTTDFEESLYFLDEPDLQALREEIRKENARDVWRDVVNALLDRLEDGSPDRQVRILAILAELVPATLSSGQFERGAMLLEELVAARSRAGLLAPEAEAELNLLFDQLGSEETIVTLAGLMEEAPERVADGLIARLLALFPARALAPLIRAVSSVEHPGVRRALEECVQRLAASNREEVVKLLDSEDPAALVGALGWIGRLRIGTAISEVSRFLKHSDASVRTAAVSALADLGAGAAGPAILPLLQDDDRETRIAAAKAVGTIGFGGARGPMESILGSRRIREADRTEKITFFESYGRLAGPEGVPYLDRILNGKGWLGKGEQPEIRACAALALAKIRHQSARNALSTASSDKDPVVRSAVARALRDEGAA